MSNIDKQAVTAKTKELASFMVERFSMNPVSCKLLNEAWKKEFPDEVAIAERMLALLDELEHYKSREERVTKLVLDNSTSWDALYKKLEAAEKRIAELTDQKATWVTWAENASGMVDMLRLRIAELERSETQLINERDSAESALNDAYKAVMGQAPEWSNWFSFENAIDEIELVCELWRNQTDDVIQFRQRIQELEARTVNLSKLSVGEVMYVSGFSRDYAEGWCAGNDNAIHEIRAAGIKVKES
ncbi:ead/Ea22-like family protein [Salmonella enterica]|uniref:Ead/Ea22-like family protein n=2 Tax=Salmonella enterica TaxID=28901 RepID=A0A722IQH7_SALER|nr:ead/Ea22-like family protein [Salmonella enterica]EBW3679279.1 ead/Ea22-like family protein [Salmonella enterica subsp. enterica serovar Give]EAN7680626.1 ead/Ea22-like family protein [Salmonella enterica]EAR1471234.1 ead/Ea22-like family protein [Salmonella enterica]EAS9828790.1 ead/Ea22-like family protein [Salmonella enterica]